MGYDEKTLPSDALVRYLLLNNDLEDGRRRVGFELVSSGLSYSRISSAKKSAGLILAGR